MDILQVNASSKQYPIYINDSFDGLKEACEKAGLAGKRVVIVTDSNVEQLYLQEVAKILGEVCPSVGAFVFPAGEASKTLATIEKMYESFMQEKLDRKSFIVALGGGVVGDMAGFAAATYLRRIPFVQIPTTLLAQVDSSVGGKTGVDFMGLKNMVGAFYQPEFVFVQTSALKTLSNEQFLSGLAEALKHGFIMDESYYEEMVAEREKIKKLDNETIAKLVKRSCEIKASVVSQDERESGLREILNFGHTFGHALETYFHFDLPHGQCVALGMICALDYSVSKGNITRDEKEQFVRILNHFGYPTVVKISNQIEEIYELMISDKKTKDGKITIVSIEKIGKYAIERNVSKDEIIKALVSIAE